VICGDCGHFRDVIAGVMLRFYQEMRADNAAEQLKAMVRSTATLLRDGKEVEVPLKVLVPGDIIRLAAGDLVPADVGCYRPRTYSSIRQYSPVNLWRLRKKPPRHLLIFRIHWSCLTSAS